MICKLFGTILKPIIVRINNSSTMLIEAINRCYRYRLKGLRDRLTKIIKRIFAVLTKLLKCILYFLRNVILRLRDLYLTFFFTLKKSFPMSFVDVKRESCCRCHCYCCCSCRRCCCRRCCCRRCCCCYCLGCCVSFLFCPYELSYMTSSLTRSRHFWQW